MASNLLLRSASRVFRRSLPQGPFRRQPLVDNRRLFSSGGVSKHSCTLENQGLRGIDNRLAGMQADIAAISRTKRASTEKLEVILQKKIENELADKKRERVLLGVFAVLGLLPFVLEKHYLVESGKNSRRSYTSN